jgi:probable HAF family extracellular repeat protein
MLNPPRGRDGKPGVSERRLSCLGRRLGFFAHREEELKKWNQLAMVFVLNALLCLASSGAAYSGGTMTDLGTLPGTTRSRAYGINNNGQIVGSSYTDSNQDHAFLYSGGTMTSLGTLGGTYSYAYGINDRGQIVGSSQTNPGSWSDGPYHAFLYSGDTKTDLGTLGGTSSWAYGINNNGQIVGSSQTDSGQIHFFYSSGAGMGEWIFTQWVSPIVATDINDKGLIVGYSKAKYGGQYHAFLCSGGKMTDLGHLGGDRAGPMVSIITVKSLVIH